MRSFACFLAPLHSKHLGLGELLGYISVSLFVSLASQPVSQSVMNQA
jgi:hypothetical protein